MLNAKLEETTSTVQDVADNKYLEDEDSNDETSENFIWKIEIPKIELDAVISEGTSDEILNEYIGHFEETKKNIGNVGLAAHNRGYKVNYFKRVKELDIGDEISYTYGNNTRIYKVASKTIIKDSDWTKLENTEDNRLTLITCLEDEPEYRRCIQAVEK